MCGLSSSVAEANLVTRSPPPVFEIILVFLETGSWEESFFSILPQRKGAMAVGASPGRDGDSNEDPPECRH